MSYTVKSNFGNFFNKLLDLRFFVIIIIIVLFVDMEISNVAHLYYNDISTDIGTATFILISFIYLIAQQYVLSYSSKEPFQIKLESSFFRRLQRLISFMIFSIVICFLTIIFEILISEYYDSFLLLLVLVLTNSISIIAMSNMATKFFSWYQMRKEQTILIYGSMYCIVAITAFVTVLFMGLLLLHQPEKIDTNYVVVLPIIEQGSTITLKLFVLLLSNGFLCHYVGDNWIALEGLHQKSRQSKILDHFITPISFLPKPIISNTIRSIYSKECFG